MAGVKLCLVAFALAACVSGGLSTCTDTTCPQDKTCCELAGGGEGCCPFEDAICCLDGIHCCPSGDVCDIERGRCIHVPHKGEEHAAFVELSTIANISVSDEHCPDGSTCPGVSTCCMKTTKHYGCCPFQEGVCCRDMIHCCPSGTRCLGGDICYRPQSENDIEGAEEALTEQAAIVTEARPSDVELAPVTSVSNVSNEHCPDGSTCPGVSTCCMMTTKHYGCCPFQEGVCCRDMIHCCPSGTRCLGGDICYRPQSENDVEGAEEPQLTTQAVIVTQASRRGVSACTDTTCPKDKTCCELATGGEGCCPFPDAICCLDGLHCCPSGDVCDLERLRCIHVPHKGEEHVAFVELSTITNISVSDEHCPDGSTCPGVSTCCMMSTKHYGCCPFPEGVCCRDMTHCCPSGTHCIGGGLCYRPQSENDIEGAEEPLTKQALIVTQASRREVSACTDTTCPRDKTCCELATGGEGCCPLPDAVCCRDGLHCCPKDFVCDEELQQCLHVPHEEEERVAFAELTAVTNIGASDEHCPDGSTCPGVSTCCLMSTKHYGCCPFQHGVCCRDMTHCCPYGSFCIGGGLCRRQDGESNLIAARVQENQQVVATKGCSGGQQRCGSDQTCCDKRDGSAACCPLKNAVCCAGLDSCCPEGFVCSPFGCLQV